MTLNQPGDMLKTLIQRVNAGLCESKKKREELGDYLRMINYSVLVFLTVLVCMLCLSDIIFAAEAYYLGAKPSHEKHLSSSTFQSSSPFTINGRVSQEVSWQDIGGNLSKSFLERGTDYITELYLNVLKNNAIADYQLTSAL